MAPVPKGAAALARVENRIVKPGAYAWLYTNPREEFARLTRNGVLTRLAHGYYAVVPEGHRAGYWAPEVEGVALGVAVADFGRDAVALMGPAAARALGAIPRALGSATVAVPRQRRAIVTTVGCAEFVKRNVGCLDTQRITTDITAGWVTTAEQTALDIADRPTLGGITPETAEEAIRALATRIDQQLVARLAREQRKPAAWQRYCWVVGLPAPTCRRDIPTMGLHGVGNPADYGLKSTTS